MEGVQMAEIRYFRNPFSEDFETKGYDFSKSLVENIDGFKTDVTEMVECYDTETGETYFVPLEDDEEHVIVTVNGKSVDENYEVQNNDVLVVIYVPLSGLTNAMTKGEAIFTGSMLGLIGGVILGVIGIAAGLITGGWGFLILAGIGAIAGAFWGADDWKKTHVGSSTTLEDKTGEQRPDVRGAENESIAGNPYPFTIGRHLMAPRIIGDPYTEYTGTKGENAYIRVLYNAGYAPVKLTDFKLGDLFLAYNRTQGVERPIMLNGLLRGHSQSGADADTGDIIDYWKTNEIELELIQNNPNTQVRKIEKRFQDNTNIDLAHRPLVDAATMRAAGWNVEDGEICTVLSESFSNEDGTKCVLVTPIVSTGDTLIEVLTEAQLETRAGEILAGTSHPEIFLAMFEGEHCIEDCEHYAIDLHENQALYYFGEQSINYGTIYPNKVVEQEINATPMFVCDELLDQQAQVVYKGASFPQNFRNNGVYFTDACPMKFTINLNAQSGLYASRSWSHKDSSDDSKTVTETVYDSLPLWYCIQWRPYDRGNNSSDSNGGDYTAWHNIEVWNGNDTIFKPYNSDAMSADTAFHKGNKITSKSILSWNKEYCGHNTIDELMNYSKTNSDLSVDGGTVKIRNKVIINDTYGFIVGKINASDSCENSVFEPSTGTLFVDAYSEIDNVSRKINGDLRDDFAYYIPETETEAGPGTREITIYTSKDEFTVTVKRFAYLRNYYTAVKANITSPSGEFGGKNLINFSAFSGSDYKGQTRISATIDLTQYTWEDEYSYEHHFDFNDLMNPNNTMKSIEIRVLRVSASYLNETQSTSVAKEGEDSYGAYSYSDVITVDTIVTEPFDEGWYREHGEVIPQKVQSEDDMKKFAFIAIKAKADVGGNIQAQLKKLTCMSESFSPVWDKTNKKWLPEGVKRVKNYYAYVELSDTPTTSPVWTNIYFKVENGVYDRVYENTYESGTEVYQVTYKNRGEDDSEEIPVTKKTYEDGRGEGKNWYCEEAGSNFGDLIKQEVFPSDDSRRDTHNGVARDYMLENDDVAKFNDSTSASSFMLACVGQQDGRWADGYKDINLLSVGEWWEDCQEVRDGSTYDYNDGVHKAGDKVIVKYEANGYITASQKKETLLKDIAATGRAVFTYDEAGKIKVVMDKPVDYAEGVINSQNCIEESHAYSFADVPPGLRIAYSDENDGYEQSSMYCWADGYNITNYRGTVEACSLKYVTNPYHAHNLGRYILACRVMKKQVMTAKIGREGRLFPLGAVVLVQSNVILLGEGSARIQQVLTKEVNGQIVAFGIVTDNVFDFKNESKNGHSTKGVQILQPKQYGKSKVVTLRLKMDGGTDTDDNNITYTQKSGNVNLFLFDSGEENVTYDFKTGDIVMLGTLDKISQKFRVIKVKPEEKGSFTMTLNLYDENLYNYGAKLPVFKVNTTRPPVVDTMPPLSEVASTVAEQEQVVSKAITLTINDTPDVLDIDTDIKEITVTTDRDAKAVTDQQSAVTVHCKINNSDVPFIIDTLHITKPQGWNCSVDPVTKQITFVIPKRTEVTKGTISIPVYYNITQDDVIYWDENNNFYTDGTRRYDDIDLTDYTLKTLCVTYSGVEGGKSLGPVSTINTIPSQPNINDYFIWSGNNEEPTELVTDGYLYTARLYRFNGNTENPKWETDEDISHNSAALGEIIKAANEVLTKEQFENNNLQGWTFLKNLAVSTLFVDYLVANNAVIHTLATSVISVGNLISDTQSEAEISDAQDSIAQNLGYSDFVDMISKAQNSGTIIDGGYIRTALIELETLFAEKIQLRSKTIEGQEYPGAIFGGKYLSDGSINSESKDFKGVYIDSLGEFKCTNGMFEGDIKSNNYQAGMLKYYVDYLFSNESEPHQIDTDLYSTPEKAIEAVPSDSHVVIIYKAIKIIDSNGTELTTMYFETPGSEIQTNYYQTSDLPNYDVSGTWTQIVWANEISNNSKKYIHFKVHNNNTSINRYYTIETEFSQDGYLLTSDGNATFIGDVRIKGNEYVTGKIEVEDSPFESNDYIGLHSNNYSLSECTGFNLAAHGNNSYERIQNLTARNITAWKKNSETYSVLPIVANSIKVGGVMCFSDISIINLGDGYSTTFSKISTLYQKCGGYYILGQGHYKYTENVQGGTSYEEDFIFIKIALERDGEFSISCYNQKGSIQTFYTTENSFTMSGNYNINEFKFITLS